MLKTVTVTGADDSVKPSDSGRGGSRVPICRVRHPVQREQEPGESRGWRSPNPEQIPVPIFRLDDGAAVPCGTKDPPGAVLPPVRAGGP